MKKESRKVNNVISPGFTLLETMVAVGILSIVIIGPLTLASSSIRAAMSSQNQITAFYLAQEGVEYVRNIRDSNNTGSGWLNGLDNCRTEINADGCIADVFDDTVFVDPQNNNLPACSGSCPLLWYNVTNGHYDYDTTSDPDSYATIFRRTIKMYKVNSDNEDEYTIEVTVDWSGKYGDKTLAVQENILNW